MEACCLELLGSQTRLSNAYIFVTAPGDCKFANGARIRSTATAPVDWPEKPRRPHKTWSEMKKKKGWPRGLEPPTPGITIQMATRIRRREKRGTIATTNRVYVLGYVPFATASYKSGSIRVRFHFWLNKSNASNLSSEIGKTSNTLRTGFCKEQ